MYTDRIVPKSCGTKRSVCIELQYPHGEIIYLISHTEIVPNVGMNDELAVMYGEN